METARSVCLAALRQVSENEGYSNIVIDKALRGAKLEKRDAALCSTLFYGVLEKQVSLDYTLSLLLKEPMQKLDTVVQEVLRMALYQIVYMDKIPESAAVNEAVALTKANGKTKYAGLVNAVLRSFLRQKDNLPAPKEGLQQKSVQYSLPAELVAFWEESYGADAAQKTMQALCTRAKLYIRVNTVKISSAALLAQLRAQGMDCEETDIPDCLCLGGVGESLAAVPAFTQGIFHVQDRASQLLCGMTAVQKEMQVADVCAAPGGKSFTLAQLLQNTGSVLSCDLYKGRVRLIEDGAKRLGLTCVHSLQRDACTPVSPQLCGVFDRVLCDVPCSGYGVIRRKPEIRRKPLASIQALPQLQLQILENSAALVKKGGVLFYSTCTLNPAENGRVADAFLHRHPEFAPWKLHLPGGRQREMDEPENQVTFFPYLFDTDGFFAAAFCKL